MMNGKPLNVDDLADNEKAFDPMDINQWTAANPVDQKMNILDDIYQATEKKIKVRIMQTRVNNMKGKQRAKTLAMERLERIEKGINLKFDGTNNLNKQMNVLEINDQAVAGEKEKFNTEKMKGRFKLTINKDLNMKKQIQKFGNEPIVFYLHKHRNFLNKLKNRQNKLSPYEDVLMLQQKMKEQNNSIKRDLWYVKRGINPKD